MLEVRKEDELVPIPLRNIVPTIPNRKSEMRELIEDLTRMGCEGLLAKPWNLQNEAMLREFLFVRESVGEDNEAGTRIVDHRSVGGCLWVRAEEGRRVGKPEGHLLHRRIQVRARSKGWVLSGGLQKP